MTSEDSDNPIQYAISLPLALLLVILLLSVEKTYIAPLVGNDGNILWGLGLFSFIAIIMGSFYFGDILINKISQRRNTSRKKNNYNDKGRGNGS